MGSDRRPSWPSRHPDPTDPPRPTRRSASTSAGALTELVKGGEHLIGAPHNVSFAAFTVFVPALHDAVGDELLKGPVCGGL